MAHVVIVVVIALVTYAFWTAYKNIRIKEVTLGVSQALPPQRGGDELC